MATLDRLFRAGARAKLRPKLRMIADGDDGVNLMRARQCGALRVAGAKGAVEGPSLEKALQAGSLALGGSAAVPRPGPLTALASGIEVSVFLDLREGTTKEQLGVPCEIRGTQAVAQLTLDKLRDLAEGDLVIQADAGAVLRAPTPLDHGPGEGPDDPPPPRAVDSQADPRGGEGVLIGIIDVEGFDFAHPDFRDGAGGTRFVRIWDQAGEGTRPPPALGAPFEYGAEFRKADLDRAIADAPGLHVEAWEIERQSQLAPGSHGTHVASIAAGTTGLCPRAKIAGVLLALAAGDEDRRRSFYDSVRLIHAVEYLLRVAAEEGCQAVAVNVSLGTNGHAHDGSDPVSRWLDAALVAPGRALSVAAGNAGQERPTSEDDIGFVTGRIHTSDAFTAAGQTRDVQFRVVGNTIEDVSENELEIWYSNRDRLAVTVIPPAGVAAIGPVEPGAEVQNQQLGDGTFVSVYNRLYHAANGDNVASVYLSPFFGPALVRGIRPGTWTVRLTARDVRDGSFHGWIERDDPRPIVVGGPVPLWSFPSFFTEASNVDERSISSLGCGQRVVCVTNFDETTGEINVSSSQGPTRDGRRKPDLAAPGTGILAANGFDPARRWARKTGTSMASPYACGVAGLMLAVNPGLTPAQIVGILQRTARPLQPGDFQWRSDACFGVIAPGAAVDEAARTAAG